MEGLTPTMRTFVEPHTSFEYEQFTGVPVIIHQLTARLQSSPQEPTSHACHA
jgi:hypothetical protein